METPIEKCGICLSETDLVFKEEHGPYKLWECSSCQGQFWNPMKNPGSEWYEKDLRYSDRNADPHKRPVMTHRYFLRKQPAPNGTLLDIGMGTGNFLNAARKRGYTVTGLDFDRGAIAIAKDHFKLEDVYPFALSEYRKEFPEKKFDVITFFEVLEHLDAPGLFIEELKSILNSNGYIALSVPYRGSFNKFKQADFPPRHLSRWNRESMKIFLESHGFTVVHTKRFHVPLDFLITKFHFWTAGYLSFGLVRKIKAAQKLAGPADDTKSPKRYKTQNRNSGIFILFLLAKTKDYLLFTIPALFLYLYLLATNQTYNGLCVIAKKNK